MCNATGPGQCMQVLPVVVPSRSMVGKRPDGVPRVPLLPCVCASQQCLAACALHLYRCPGAGPPCMSIRLHNQPLGAPHSPSSHALPRLYFFLGCVCFSFWMTTLNTPVTSGCCGHRHTADSRQPGVASYSTACYNQLGPQLRLKGARQPACNAAVHAACWAVFSENTTSRQAFSLPSLIAGLSHQLDRALECAQGLDLWHLQVVVRQAAACLLVDCINHLLPGHTGRPYPQRKESRTCAQTQPQCGEGSEVNGLRRHAGTAALHSLLQAAATSSPLGTLQDALRPRTGCESEVQHLRTVSLTACQQPTHAL